MFNSLVFQKHNHFRLKLLIFIPVFLFYLYLFDKISFGWYYSNFDLYDADSRELYTSSRYLYLNADLIKHPLYFSVLIPLVSFLDNILNLSLLNIYRIIFPTLVALSITIFCFLFHAFTQNLKLAFLYACILASSSSFVFLLPQPETYSFSLVFLSLFLFYLTQYSSRLNPFYVGTLIGLVGSAHFSLILFLPATLVSLFTVNSLPNYKSVRFALILTISSILVFSFPFLLMVCGGSDNLVGSTLEYTEHYASVANLISLKYWLFVLSHSGLASLFLFLPYSAPPIPSFSPYFFITAICTLFIIFRGFIQSYSSRTHLLFLPTIVYFFLFQIIFTVYFHPPSTFLYSTLLFPVFLCLYVFIITIDASLQTKYLFFLMSLLFMLLVVNLSLLQSFYGSFSPYPVFQGPSFKPVGPAHSFQF